MTWVVPVELEDAVYEAAREVLGDAALATSALTKAIVDRSKRYTSERDRLAAPSDPKADLAARAAFFTVADAMKIGIPLGELTGRGALPAHRPLRIVDVGAGCGAMSLGIVACLESDATGDAAFAITAIDRDVDALRIAAAALRRFGEHRGTTPAITTRVADVATTSLPSADLVVLGTVLNELAPAGRVDLVQRALAATDAQGAVIIIEPALRETSRDLLEVRDIMVEGGFSVYSPCLGNKVCPARANPKDWCHEDIPWEPSELLREIDKRTGLRKDSLKFSYLVLRKDGLTLADVCGAHAFRVVSEPLVSKGKIEYHVCGADGRRLMVRLDKDASPSNKDYEKLRRGSIVTFEHLQDEEKRYKVGRQTVVHRFFLHDRNAS